MYGWLWVSAQSIHKNTEFIMHLTKIQSIQDIWLYIATRACQYITLIGAKKLGASNAW